MFHCLDNTLFVTIAALRLAQMDEAKLALLLSHELAHHLLDHQVYRLGASLLRDRILQPYFFSWLDQSDKRDPIQADFKNRTKLQSYSSYYP